MAEKQNLVTETKVLKRKVSRVQEIVEQCRAIRKIKETIDKVVPLMHASSSEWKKRVGKEIRPDGYT